MSITTLYNEDKIILKYKKNNQIYQEIWKYALNSRCTMRNAAERILTNCGWLDGSEFCTKAYSHSKICVIYHYSVFSFASVDHHYMY